jgi:hypothetical protein
MRTDTRRYTEIYADMATVDKEQINHVFFFPAILRGRASTENRKNRNETVTGTLLIYFEKPVFHDLPGTNYIVFLNSDICWGRNCLQIHVWGRTVSPSPIRTLIRKDHPQMPVHNLEMRSAMSTGHQTGFCHILLLGR